MTAPYVRVLVIDDDTRVPADLKEMLTTKLDAVKGALKADDLDLIKSTTEDLEKSLGELAQAAQAAGGPMPDMGGAAPDVAPADDEVPSLRGVLRFGAADGIPPESGFRGRMSSNRFDVI